MPVKTIVIVCIMIFLSNAREKPQCKALIDSGNVYYNAFQTEQALELYREALEKCPRDFNALFKVIRTLDDRGEELEKKKAMPYFREAYKLSDTMLFLFPDSGKSYFLKAVSAGNIARYERIRAQIKLSQIIEQNAKKAVALAPNYAPAYVLLGIFYREVASVTHFQRHLARAFFGKVPQGTFEDSRRCLLKAIELQPDGMFAHYQLAQTELKLKSRDEAIRNLERTIELTPANKVEKTAQEKARKQLSELKNGRH